MLDNRIELENWRQIEDLNQRGGRMLSVVDLIRAGTIDLDIAAFVCDKVSRGASILTAARPGGAGKTTVMAAFLGFIPPATRIVTVSDSSALDPKKLSGLNPVYLMAHEIGSGHYYGYIWGEDVRRYFSLIEPGRSVASNLHADTLEELMAVMEGLKVPSQLIGRVDLIIFMTVLGRSFANVRRRVSAVYESVEGRHRLVFRYNPGGDNFECLIPDVFTERVKRMRGFINELVCGRDFEYLSVRKRFLEFYSEVQR